MIRMRRIGVVAAVLAGAAMLAGCNNVSKTKYEAAVQEANDLRERNGQLEQSNRDKDTRIADLESRGSTNQGYSAPAGTTPASNTGGGMTPSWSSGNDEDFRNDNGRMVAEIAGDVLFDSGQATVKSGAKKQLDRIAKKLTSTYAGATIRIEGHTDTDQPKKMKKTYPTNEALSEARASAVRKYLSSKGVPNSRMTTVGMGSSQPKSSKAASRRVEIIVMAN